MKYLAIALVASTCSMGSPPVERPMVMLCQPYSFGMEFTLPRDECVVTSLDFGLVEYRHPMPIYCKCVVMRNIGVVVEGERWIMRGCKPDHEVPGTPEGPAKVLVPGIPDHQEGAE